LLSFRKPHPSGNGKEAIANQSWCFWIHTRTIPNHKMPTNRIRNDLTEFRESESPERVTELRYQMLQFNYFHSIANQNAVHTKPAISRL
jgi:hypothetical protein